MKVHLPYKLIFYILEFLELFKLKIPIKSEQILRLNEDKVLSSQKLLEDFNFKPLSLAGGIKKEITLINKLS